MVLVEIIFTSLHFNLHSVFPANHLPHVTQPNWQKLTTINKHQRTQTTKSNNTQLTYVTTLVNYCLLLNGSVPFLHKIMDSFWVLLWSICIEQSISIGHWKLLCAYSDHALHGVYVYSQWEHSDLDWHNLSRGVWYSPRNTGSNC